MYQTPSKYMNTPTAWLGKMKKKVHDGFQDNYFGSDVIINECEKS